MSAPVENRQLIRHERRMEPEQVVVCQQKIIFIGDEADVGIGAQTGFIRPQVAGFCQRRRSRFAQISGRIIGNRNWSK